MMSTFDPALGPLFAQLRAQGAPDLADLPLPVARDAYLAILRSGATPDEPGVTTRSLEWEGPSGPLPLRVYRGPGAGPQATVLWYHGGGYTMGHVDGYASVCRQLCADSGVQVIALGYRLAPEHPYPAAFEDAWAGLRWVVDHAQALDVDPQRLAVAGDSAGAVLATAVAALARDARAAGAPDVPPLRLQALLYPPAAGGDDGDFPSRALHAGGPTLTARTAALFQQSAFGAAGVAPDWRGAPLRSASQGGMAPAFIQLAGFDLLRDEGLAYARALNEAGTPVTLVEYHGLPHGFVSMGGQSPAARLAQRQLADALRAALQ